MRKRRKYCKLSFLIFFWGKLFLEGVANYEIYVSRSFSPSFTSFIFFFLTFRFFFVISNELTCTLCKFHPITGSYKF